MFATPALAQATGAAPGGAGSFLFIVPYALIFVVMYLLLFRPQQKRAKEHAAKLAAVKKGDQVVTGGGLVGKVTRIDDAHVEVELAPNVRVRAVKATLSDVLTVTAKPAND